MTDTTTLYVAFGTVVEAVLSQLVAEGVLPDDTSFANVTLEPPRDASHGDIATNAAMVLAKAAKPIRGPSRSTSLPSSNSTPP